MSTESDQAALGQAANVKKSLLRAIFEFVFCTAILFCIASFAYTSIDHRLTDSLEQAVEKHSRTIAFALRQQFEQEIGELRLAASIMEVSKVQAAELFNVVLSGHEGVSMGIMQMRGRPLAGRFLPQNAWADIDRAVEGAEVAVYRHGCGMLFAVPVSVGPLRAALYKVYDDEAFRRTFKALSYNGDGTLLLSYGRDCHAADAMVLSRGADFIEDSRHVETGWDKLREKLSAAPHTAFFYETCGEPYFLFASKVFPDQDDQLLISGYVPWNVVAIGLNYIYLVMLVAFCLLMLGMFMTMRYLMTAREGKSLKKEKELADAANQAKSEFLSNMSHEIRTPINAIMGMDVMILRESKEPPTLEYAESINRAAVNLLGIVNDILDFSKIEAGKMEIIPVEYQLSSLLNDLVNMISDRAAKKGLEFHIEAEPHLPAMMRGDEIRLKQVITNILTNAVKYTEQGSVTLRVKREQDESHDMLLYVEVADTGIGIKEEDMQHLFSAFERIEEKRNRSIEGTGLGMCITTKLLQLMDSSLQVNSVYGQGSVFSCRIPQEVIGSDELGDFEEAIRGARLRHPVYHEKFIAPQATILVVDDTPINLKVVEGLLKQTQIKIDTAQSGAQCLKMVRDKHYDLIFLDHRMPQMDGIETLQHMRKLGDYPNAATPVISLTANAISGSREIYLKAGFTDYLTKPINADHLESMMMKYLPKEKVIIAKLSATKTADSSGANTGELAADAVKSEAVTDSEEGIRAALQKVEGLQLEDGVANCGSWDNLLPVLKIYAEGAPAAAEQLDGFLTAGNLKDYTVKVHALKSSSRIIGALELSELAKALEAAGNAADEATIRREHAHLLELYRTIGAAITAVLGGNRDEGKDERSQLGDEELKDALATLKETAAAFDYDSVSFVLKSLEDYRLPDKVAATLTKFKEAVESLNWQSAQEILKTLNSE